MPNIMVFCQNFYMCNLCFFLSVRCELSPVFLRESKEKLKEKCAKWKSEKVWGCQHPACLIKCVGLCTQHMTGLRQGTWHTCGHELLLSFPSNALGSYPQQPPSWRQKNPWVGNERGLSKHKNFSECSKNEEKKRTVSAKCWNVTFESSLGKCQSDRPQLYPLRGKVKSSSPGWQRLYFSECSSMRRGSHWATLTTSPPFQGCLG